MWVVDCSPQQISIMSQISQHFLYLKVTSRARKQLGSLLGAFILENDSTHCVDDYTLLFQSTASKCITPRYTQLRANMLLIGINCGFNMGTIYKMHNHILLLSICCFYEFVNSPKCGKLQYINCHDVFFCIHLCHFRVLVFISVYFSLVSAPVCPQLSLSLRCFLFC